MGHSAGGFEQDEAASGIAGDNAATDGAAGEREVIAFVIVAAE